MEAVIEEKPAETNGTAAVAAKAKPWLALGFKSRDAWRASKGQKTGKKKPAVKAAAPKKTSKPKVKKPAKLKAKSKVVKKAKKTPAEKRAAKLRTASFVKVLKRREEPNKDEQKVLQALGKGKESNIIDLAKKCFGSKPYDKRYLIVKNALRWLVASKKFKQVGRGAYRRIK